MFRLTCCRFFSSSRVSMSVTKSSALGKLRKSTGFSISNCKKALELFPDDVSKAEEWLHAEAKQKGWAKWSKIESRTATQGLIGVFTHNRAGVMLEVNCETDFVAKNAEFQEFVENMLKGCMNHATSLNCDSEVTKVVLEETKLSTLKSGSNTVGELVVSAVSKFNEKTVAKRAVCFKVRDDVFLSCLTHPSTKCQNLVGATLGKYGTLLAYKKKSETDVDINELGQNICQHVIGMNPASLGELTDEELDKMLGKQTCEENEPQAVEKASSDSLVEEVDEKENTENLGTDVKETNETRLLFQPFLLDSNSRVGVMLHNAGLEILDFERFECGESSAERDVTEAGEKLVSHA